TVYFPEHPRVADSAAKLAKEVETALAVDGDAGLFFGVTDRRLVFEGKFLLRRGLAATEVAAFFALCAASRSKCADLDKARRLFVSRGILSIELPAPG